MAAVHSYVIPLPNPNPNPTQDPDGSLLFAYLQPMGESMQMPEPHAMSSAASQTKGPIASAAGLGPLMEESASQRSRVGGRVRVRVKLDLWYPYMPMHACACVSLGP